MTSLRRAVCRDCFAAVPGDGRRCPACSSPRLAFWPADEDLTIAHIDCDAFYAAVEKRDNPTLADKPLIIGGGKRGVVATACYVARTYGVRSAMPMFKALAACPDAVVIKPDMAKYVAVGRDIRARMERLTPLVEPLSIDEAFLDLTGTERVHDAPAAVVLARFAAAIERDIGVTVSVGLSYCKFLAKVASDLDKPRGFATIGRADALSFLATRPVGVIWGVGRVMQDKLARDGITLIGDLQRLDEATLMRRYGGEGQRLSRLSRGIDTRPVDPVRDTKSVSAETTFGQDLDALPDLTRALFRLCERVSSRLKAKDLAGRTVTLKLKTNDFRLRTRARALPEPTQLAGRFFEAARELLAREVDGTAFRLIGIGTSDLAPADLADRGDLVDVKIIRDKAMERAVDTLRARFGGEAIGRGIGLGIAPRRPVREP